jgi:hypothetical protein
LIERAGDAVPARALLVNGITPRPGFAFAAEQLEVEGVELGGGFPTHQDGAVGLRVGAKIEQRHGRAGAEDQRQAEQASQQEASDMNNCGVLHH